MACYPPSFDVTNKATAASSDAFPTSAAAYVTSSSAAYGNMASYPTSFSNTAHEGTMASYPLRPLHFLILLPERCKDDFD